MLKQIKQFFKKLFFDNLAESKDSWLKCENCESHELEYHSESCDGFDIEFECKDCKHKTII